MLETATRLRVVDCAGTPREIGMAHGESCREAIAAVFERWVADKAERVGAPGDAYLAAFLAETAFLPAIARHTSDLLEEVRGIAEGAAQPFDRVLAYTLMDEEWSYRRETLGRAPLGAVGPPPGCTAVALGARVIAQTMDIPTVHDATQVALRIRPNDGPDQIVFSAAGMIGLNGANADGVGVVVNSLAQLPASWAGLPVGMVVREILGRSTAAEAAAFVESVPHAIGQHYLIGDGTETISLEAAANEVRRVPVGERYVHANHPLVNLKRAADADAIERISNTHARHERAVTLIDGATEPERAEAALADREAPISCDRDRGSMTFGATSIRWDRVGAPTVRITPGPPHETAWQTVGWA